MLVVRQYRPRRVSGGVQPLEPGFPFDQAAHELVKTVLRIRSEPVQQFRQVVVSRDIDQSSGQYGARQHGMPAAEPIRDCIEQRVRRTHVSAARVLHERVAVPSIERHAAERGVLSGPDAVEQPALGSEARVVEICLASRHEKRAGGSETGDQMAESGDGLAGRRLHDHLFETVERRHQHAEAHQLDERLVVEELKAQPVDERRNDDVIEPQKRPPAQWNGDEQPVRSPGLVRFRLLDGQKVDQRRLSFACIRRQVDDRRRTGHAAIEHPGQCFDDVLPCGILVRGRSIGLIEKTSGRLDEVARRRHVRADAVRQQRDARDAIHDPRLGAQPLLVLFDDQPLRTLMQSCADRLVPHLNDQFTTARVQVIAVVGEAGHDPPEFIELHARLLYFDLRVLPGLQTAIPIRRRPAATRNHVDDLRSSQEYETNTRPQIVVSGDHDQGLRRRLRQMHQIDGDRCQR